ncbi:MAG: hypothetical protein ACKVOR_02500 [Flavobacteriales bacterium]
MAATWHYLTNQFVSATVNSFKKANRLSQHHDNVLEQRAGAGVPDPLDVQLYASYHPLHVALTEKYTAWKNAGGQQEGQTLNLDQLFALTKTRLDTWDPLIQVVHIKSSPAYKAIFPDARKPFYRKITEERIAAFNTLQQALTNPALAAVKTSVVAHHTALVAARSVQTGAIAATGTGSAQVEEARIAAMIGQYANLGLLMNKYADNTNFIEAYFELEVLRDIAQILFTGILDPGEVESVLVHTFFPGDKLNVANEGTVEFRLFLDSVVAGQGNTGLVIAPGDDREIDISEFGAPDLNTARYLTAVNTTGIATNYEIELI